MVHVCSLECVLLEGYEGLHRIIKGYIGILKVTSGYIWLRKDY